MQSEAYLLPLMTLSFPAAVLPGRRTFGTPCPASSVLVLGKLSAESVHEACGLRFICQLRLPAAPRDCLLRRQASRLSCVSAEGYSRSGGPLRRLLRGLRAAEGRQGVGGLKSTSRSFLSAHGLNFLRARAIWVTLHTAVYVNGYNGSNGSRRQASEVLMGKITLNPVEVKALAALGKNQEQIAADLGVSGDTLYRRKQEDPAIEEALRDGYAEANGRVENTLYKMATSGTCVAATIYWLKCRCPEKWSDRQRVDLTAGGEPVQIQIINDLKD